MLPFFNILFRIPQISVRFADLPENHGKMRRFQPSFFPAHRDILQKTDLTPCYPDHNNPVVYAVDEKSGLPCTARASVQYSDWNPMPE